MHSTRWLTSIVALPVLLLIIFKGGPIPFAVLIGAASLLAMWEYYRIVSHPQFDTPGLILSWTIGSAVVWSVSQANTAMALVLIVLHVMGSGVIALFRFGKDPSAVERIYKQALGIIYVPVLLSCLLLLRAGSDGPVWILVALCLSFGGDTGAYYAGTYLGRHKLCPVVSPKKTIEGAVGGLAASVILAVVVKLLFLPAVPVGSALVFFILAAIASQVGDLFESILKRAAGIKDSGSLLPGHGGILDRIDGLLFVAPVLCSFRLFLAGS